MTRLRPAPRAMRTAISARRVVARANNRLAMLAQAISSTTRGENHQHLEPLAGLLLQVLDSAAAGREDDMHLGNDGRCRRWRCSSARHRAIAAAVTVILACNAPMLVPGRTRPSG